jgi:septum site-determining protein MinC
MTVSFEIKSAQLPLVALLLKTSDVHAIQAELLTQFGPKSDNPDFFDDDALVIDANVVQQHEPASDLKSLLLVLRTCHLIPVAIRSENAAWIEAGRVLGLVNASLEPSRFRDIELDRAPFAAPIEIVKEVITEVIREVPGPSTMVIDKPLRSGQKIYARGADLVVLAMVNQGAEVVADGNIHVYAPLRGKAMAGARGNTNARIFSLCLEPELISIAGVYRTSENPLPKDIHGKAAQVRLSSDGQEKLLIEALKT